MWVEKQRSEIIYKIRISCRRSNELKDNLPNPVPVTAYLFALSYCAGQGTSTFNSFAACNGK